LQFLDILVDLVQSVEGASGAIFLDGDGEAVQWYPPLDADRLRLRAAYLAVVVKAFRLSSEKLRLGAIRALVVQYEGAQFVIEEIEGGYFLVLEMSPSANIAQGIGRIAPTVSSLRREIDT
jgi:predicted regulator of Ras-like GTPase activity (Roadblock/LC7/MglB family)